MRCHSLTSTGSVLIEHEGNKTTYFQLFIWKLSVLKTQKFFPDSLLSIRTPIFHPDLYLPFPFRAITAPTLCSREAQS
nr:MAG TPA: hypothetical protein [Caudoviricetes sp.]